MKIDYVSDYPKLKASHRAKLRGCQVLPLTGDGRLANLYNRASYGNIEAQRERLVAARYQDWLDSRATLFAEG